jgi:hypothetical protein
MFGIPGNWLVAGLMAAAGIAWALRAWWLPAVQKPLGSLASWWKGDKAAEPTIAERLEALQIVGLHYKALNCPECDQALKVLKAHFLDEAPA